MEVLLIIIGIVLGALLYFIPSIVASRRKHPNATAIFVLNLLLGGTVIGWAVALIWAVSKDPALGVEVRTAPAAPEETIAAAPGTDTGWQWGTAVAWTVALVSFAWGLYNWSVANRARHAQAAAVGELMESNVSLIRQRSTLDSEIAALKARSPDAELRAMYLKANAAGAQWKALAESRAATIADLEAKLQAALARAQAAATPKTPSFSFAPARFPTAPTAASYPPTYYPPSAERATPTGGTVQVQGYTRSDGTYVAPHTRAAPTRR